MCLFCEFLSGTRKKHTNGFPFKILRETKHTVSFLSIDFPKKEDGHVLVVPKKHYANIEEIPKIILHDLVEHVALACRITKQNHEACNVLLNNGKESGQEIFHLHFHIVPRDSGDNIKIEVWKKERMPKNEFNILIRKLTKQFNA
jgi:histidine triad (HIT) family protein